MLDRSQQAGLAPSFAVLKKHRASDAPLSCLVDGYSLALDYPVRRGQEEKLRALLTTLNDVAAEAGGRIYFAKDSTLTPAQTQRMYGAEALEQFHALKQQYDPQGLLTTDLYQRAIAPLFRRMIAPIRRGLQAPPCPPNTLPQTELRSFLWSGQAFDDLYIGQLQQLLWVEEKLTRTIATAHYHLLRLHDSAIDIDGHIMMPIAVTPPISMPVRCMSSPHRQRRLSSRPSAHRPSDSRPAGSCQARHTRHIGLAQLFAMRPESCSRPGQARHGNAHRRRRYRQFPAYTRVPCTLFRTERERFNKRQ